MDRHSDVLKTGETMVSHDIMDLDHLWSPNCQTMPNFMEEITKDVKFKEPCII